VRCWERDTKRRAQQQQQQQQKQEEEEQQQKQKLWRRWELWRLHLGSSQSTRRKLGAESGVPSEQKETSERTNDGEAKVEGWNIDDGTCGVDAFVRGCVRAYTKEKDEKGSER
jgi:hypothetical protein